LIDSNLLKDSNSIFEEIRGALQNEAIISNKNALDQMIAKEGLFNNAQI